jgi:hypothetical protein
MTHLDHPAPANQTSSLSIARLDRDELLAQVERIRQARQTPVPTVDSERHAPRFRIRVESTLTAPPAMREYTFDKACVSCGRARDNDVVLPSPQHTLSRYHSEIHYHEPWFWLVDLHSCNATHIEGRALNPAERYPLFEGDTFVLDGNRITFLGPV